MQLAVLLSSDYFDMEDIVNFTGRTSLETKANAYKQDQAWLDAMYLHRVWRRAVMIPNANLHWSVQQMILTGLLDHTLVVRLIHSSKPRVFCLDRHLPRTNACAHKCINYLIDGHQMVSCWRFCCFSINFIARQCHGLSTISMLPGRRVCDPQYTWVLRHGN